MVNGKFTKFAIGDEALTTPRKESPELPQLEFHGQSDDDVVFNRFTVTPTKTTTVVTTMTYRIDSGIAPVLESTTTTTSLEDNNTIDDMVKIYGVSDVKDVEFEFDKDSSSPNPINPILSVGHQTPFKKSTDDSMIKPSVVVIDSDTILASDSSSKSTDAKNTDKINEMMKACGIMDRKDIASSSSMCSNSFSPNLQSTPSKNATGDISLKKSNDDFKTKITYSNFAGELSNALADHTYPPCGQPLRKKLHGRRKMNMARRSVSFDSVRKVPSPCVADLLIGQFSPIFEDYSAAMMSNIGKPLIPPNSIPKISQGVPRKLGRQLSQLINKDNSSDAIDNSQIAPPPKLKSFAPKTTTRKLDYEVEWKSYVDVPFKTLALIPQSAPMNMEISSTLTDCRKNVQKLSNNVASSYIDQQLPLQKFDFDFASKSSFDGSFKKPALIPKSSEVDMDTSSDCLINLPTPKFDQMDGISFEGLNNLPNLSNNVAYSHIGPQIPLQNVVDNSQMDMGNDSDSINNLPNLPCISASPSIGQQIVDDSFNLPDCVPQTNRFTTQKYTFDLLPCILPSPPKRASSLKRLLENPNNKYVSPLKKFCE